MLELALNSVQLYIMVNWYTISTSPGKENRARDMLIQRAVNTGLWADSIFDVVIPVEKEFATRRKKRVVVDKKVFPGYIFVKMYLNEHTEQIVMGTDGVKGFVKSGTKPAPVTDMEIQGILARIEHSNSEGPKSHYSVNDIVNIVSGPFADFTAKIESVDESKGKLKAYVNIFGRDTAVELAIQDIEPIH